MVPPHGHDDAESWYVVQGAVQVYQASGGWTERGADASFRIAGGTRHALRNGADAPAGMLLITTVRMARFFRAIGTSATAASAGPPSPEALRRLAEAALRFGRWLGSTTNDAAIGPRTGRGHDRGAVLEQAAVPGADARRPDVHRGPATTAAFDPGPTRL